MSIPKLLWGCLWRATLLCLASGAVLGGIYGVLIAGTTFIVPVFTQDYPSQVMSETEEFRSASAVIFFVSFIGGGVGAMMGAAMGLATGLILGAALAALTRVSFSRTPDPGAYRKIAGRTGALAPLPLLPVLWAAYGPVSADHLLGLAPVPPLLLGVVPVLILSLVGWFVGRFVAGWWAAVNRQTAPLA